MRRSLDRFVAATAFICLGLALLVLTGLLAAILLRGLPAVSWHFLTEQIRSVGAAGGIFYNLLGTVILIATAALAGGLPAIGVALVQTVYLRGARARERLGLVLYLINGVPSILFGLIGLIVFVQFLGWGKSWLSGGLLLGFMILPTVTISLAERIRSLPAPYLEAAAGLGLSRSQIIRSVILRQSWGAWVTGILIGLARAAGEVAPIMFTATIFAGATIPPGIKESPVLSLPYHIFILAQDSFDPRVKEKLWGTALVLLFLVVGLSAIALPSRIHTHDEAAQA